MKLHFLILIMFSVLIFSSLPAVSQNDTIYNETPDSIMEKRHSPTKATIMSACLPGLGQIYNKKVWKVPIIYAGFGVFCYFIYTNTDEYLNYKCAYIESSNGDMNGSYSDLVKKYSKDELLSAREYYRRNLEISCLLTAVWYALNILDATVDAHLYTFNISDKLTLRVEPAFQPTGISFKPATGIRISLHF